MTVRILVIDDEPAQRQILADILQDAGYLTETAAGGEEGIRKIFRGSFDIVLTDLKMPDRDGLEVLKEAVAFNPDLQVVLMTAFGSIPGAVQAIKNGAFDYLTKPFDKENLLNVMAKAAEKVRLVAENRRLKKLLGEQFQYRNIIGGSPAMRKLFEMIEKIKNVDATVLITGESGTGKELVARAIHYSGGRKEGPFVAVNCGAIPENLMESELFGHCKGAFTHALRDYPGRFEQAQNGTLFLDEIGVMPPALQVKLLRVLQERVVQRVGGSKNIPLDIRIIAATNESLPELVEQGRFRLDLYHRLNVLHLHLPPLRERKEDIPRLIHHFLQKFNNRYQKNIRGISPEALHMLENYTFPGNVRELENIMEKSVLLCEADFLEPPHLMLPRQDLGEMDAEIPAELPRLEYAMIVKALKQSSGSIKKAAENLGISYKTLQYRMKKLGLRKEDFRD
ncbi:MAG: sigma-54 dependent transcriptional regulator [Calditrichia bacterium]